jgi:16S rRNA (cytosine967-C5)-methyltransferase
MVETEPADLRDVADRDDPPVADRVLVDVPCSGLGVLAKRADLRWQREPDDLDELLALQDELLDAAAALVAPGGLLVYSTCTIEPEENEERVEAFLARHDDFALESAEGHVLDEVVSDAGYLTTLPHRNRTDGAFAARLRRVTS